MTLRYLRQTWPDNRIGTIRLVLGILFVMTGFMKLVVPVLAEAWSGQLIAAGLPFYTLTRWVVPFVEVALGFLLVVGLYARLAGGVVLVIMGVATYVHLVVHDPALFPLQPRAPLLPLAVIVLVAHVIWNGAGSWSLDLKATGAAA
jgi:putative oxidoreductase